MPADRLTGNGNAAPTPSSRPPSDPTLPCIEALILAGGAGTRMSGVADPRLRGVPKSLLPIFVGGTATTVLDYQIEGLARSGFVRVGLLTGIGPGRGGTAIAAYVADRYPPSNRPAIVAEGTPRGTAAAIMGGLRRTCVEDVIVVPGDILFPFEVLPSAVASHRTSGSPLTWLVTSRSGVGDQNVGCVWLDSGARVVATVEAGVAGELRRGLGRGRPVTSTGVAIVDRERCLRLFAEFVHARGRVPADLYREFIPWLLASGHSVHGFDIRRDGAHDLGTPARLVAFGGRVESSADKPDTT